MMDRKIRNLGSSKAHSILNTTRRKRSKKSSKRHDDRSREMTEALGTPQKERKLVESEQKFRSLVEDTAAGVAAADLTGQLTYTNRALADLLGYSVQELSGRSFADFLHPADRERVMGLFIRGISSSRQAPNIEFRAVRKDASIRYLWSRPTRLIVEGKTVGFEAIIIDITERKRMEDELQRHSEHLGELIFEKTKELTAARERLERVISSNPAVIYTAKPRIDQSDFDATYMSESVAQALGFGSRELIDNPQLWETRLHPDDLGRYRAELPRLWKEGHYVFESRFLHKDGTYRWLHEEARLIRDASGEPVEVIGYWTDITERKRAEVALQAAKDYAENLIQTANAMVVGLDSHGKIQVFNQAAERITGYSRKELEGRNWFEVIVPKDRYPEVWREFERLTAGGLPKNFENPILTKSGEERYVVWQNNEVHEQGQIVGTISFGIDITERKRLEEELRAARERLEYVIASNPAVIYAGKPLADYSDFVLTYLSERVASILGFEPREFIGHPEFWEHHVHPEDVSSVMAEMPRFWKEGQHTFEYRFLHKDGAYRWIREEAKVVRDADGNPIEVNGYWTDVTEEKRMQEALLRSERLAAIGEMATMMAHDLRNPLTGISGAAYHLRKKVGATGDGKSQEMLDLIEKDVEHANRIMSDLLEYSRELHLDLAGTSPRSIIEQALALVEIPGEIRVSNLTSDQPEVRIDTEKMKRVFVNLIRNAVDAMPQAGELTIQSKESNGNLHVTLSDTGPGITEDVASRIWMPFFTTKSKGIGLGLSISKRIVEAHKGSISYETEIGKGTTFIVTIPLEARIHD